MDSQLIVPDSCLRELLAQRTGCKKAADPAATWAASIRADWREVSKWIPARVRSSLDIGCGLAGFDVLLWRARKPFMYLLDRDRFDAVVRYGYGSPASAYCNFSQVMELMEVNRVRSSDYETIVSTMEIFGQVDLVTSFIAWGFHFSVGAYLNAVAIFLAPGGRLILDLRRGTTAEAMPLLRARFGRPLAVYPHEKHVRVVFEKRAP